MTNLIKNLFIVFMISLNIIIIIKSKKLQTERNAYIKQNIELSSLLLLHRNYVIDNMQEIPITFIDIFGQINFTLEPKKENIFWIVMIPQNVCMSCVSSLFSELANLKISKTNLYLVHEYPVKNIEREWHAYQFKNYYIDSQKKIFTKHDFNGKIILAKVDIEKKRISFFRYDSELHEYLNYFIQ